MWRLHDRSEGKMPIDRAKTIKCLIWSYHWMKVLYNTCMYIVILSFFINIYKKCKELSI